eukprot:TRINITY_DN2308_c0_g1_i1.p1 TRINITY_DN2308_c0_g1~~TRINITY_DN2308_c0_g1_i1.p1  ORF type:complete len:239 (+),score=53.72 TRINITY_DN2308_c0_g1_i1:108-824(+)
MAHVPLFHNNDPHAHHHSIKKTRHAKRAAKWLPEHAHVEGWLDELVRQTSGVVAKYDKGEISLSPPMQRFHDAVMNDPVLRMYFEEMIQQPVVGKPYRAASAPFNTVSELMVAMDFAIKLGPRYDDTALVGCPLNAVLDYCSATPAGFAAFRDQRVNALIRDVLKEWCKFLSSPESCIVLDNSKSGWLSEHAKASINLDWFEHDPSKPNHGYTSWNDFFTRKFKEGMRPIASPEDDKL